MANQALDDKALVARPATLEEVASARRRLAVVLTFVMVVIYFTFILLVAFDKSLMARILTDGLSLGMLLGVVVILATWVVTLIYVIWANRHYEPAVQRLRR
jgi:uncharacterized membrane protein (DUF485 family)